MTPEGKNEDFLDKDILEKVFNFLCEGLAFILNREIINSKKEERERCAKIADDFDTCTQDGVQIAKAIREEK